MILANVFAMGQYQYQWCYGTGFEQTAPGTYTAANSISGWSLSSGTSASCGTVSWTPGSTEFSVVATPLLNSELGTLVHAPNGGTNVAVLNSKNPNGSITRLQKALIHNNVNYSLEMNYAGAWQTSTHSCCAQAGFRIRVTDSLGVPLTCMTWSYSGTSCTNLDGYSQGTGYNYVTWQQRYLDLNAYLGKTVILEVEARDCSNGDHWGYLYFDVYCRPVDGFPSPAPEPPRSFFCQDASSALLIAPTNWYSYNWLAPPGHSISPQQSTLSAISISNPVPNLVYTVQATTAGGCTVDYTIALTTSTVSIAGINSSPSCSLGASGSASVMGVGSGTGYQYTWLNSTNSVVSTSSVATNLPPGIYTVQVQAAGSLSTTCGIVTATTQVGADPASLQILNAPFCAGQSAYIYAGAGTGHQWYVNNTPVAAVNGGTNTVLKINAPSNGQAYVVAYSTQQGCRDSVKYFLSLSPPGNVSVTGNSLTCAGTTTGSAIISYTPAAFVPLNNNSTITVTSLSNTPTFSFSLVGNSTASLTGLAANGNYSVNAFDGHCLYTTSFSVNTQPRPNFSISPGPTATVCAPSSLFVKAQPTGASSNSFTYTWSPATWLLGNSTHLSSTIITPTLAPGTSSTVVYTVVADPITIHCPAQQSFTLTAIHPVTPTLVPVPPVCQGATVQLSGVPAGGVFSGPSSAISVNGILDASKLSPGTHNFAYTNSMGSCHASAFSHFTINPLPVVSVNGNTSICSGESATLTASGAQSYQWPGLPNAPQVVVSPAITSSYVVTGTSSDGCVASKSLVVMVTPTPTLAVTGPTNICTGDSLSLTASGADQYFWSTQDSTAQIFLAPASTATYSVTGTNLPAYCTNTAVFTVSVLPLPQLLVSGPTSVCIGDQVTITATGAQSYLWNGVPGGPTYSMILQSTDTFTIKGTGQNGCSQVAHHVIAAGPCAGVTEITTSHITPVYPNPVIDKLYITVEYEAEITLTDAIGKLILKKDFRAGSHALNLESYADGTYYLLVKTAAGISTTKVIKRK